MHDDEIWEKWIERWLWVELERSAACCTEVVKTW